MPPYQPYNLPGLLNAFPLQRALQANRVSRTRQLVGLLKQGLGEYSNRLEGLDQQLAQQPGGRFTRPYDTTSDSYGPAVQGTTGGAMEVSAEPREVSVQGGEGSRRLAESQVQYIFEELAKQHRTLNSRGYPYTSDVTDEQEMHYGKEYQPVTRDEKEDAWDDWSDEHSKGLFRRHRERDEDDDDYDYDRGRRRHRLSRNQLEVIFRRLYREGVRLDRRGFPYPEEVREEQRAIYRHTRPRSRRG